MFIDIFGDTPPEKQWLQHLFALEDMYWEVCDLNPAQRKSFQKILMHAELTSATRTKPLFKIIKHIGWQTDTAWGIILTHLAVNNPQIAWYILHFAVLQNYPRKQVLNLLQDCGKDEKNAKNIHSAFGKLLDLPLGQSLRFGQITADGTCMRTPCSLSDARVVMYALFKLTEVYNIQKGQPIGTLVENTGDHRQMTLSKIFGLSHEELMQIIKKLSLKYHNFIQCSYNNDVVDIVLAEDQNTASVLALFMEADYDWQKNPS